MTDNSDQASSNIQLFAITLLALLAFAGNSLLNRYALAVEEMDAVQFAVIRLVSGALFLWAFCALWPQQKNAPDNSSTNKDGTSKTRAIPSGLQQSRKAGLALLVYALPFSLAYVSIAAGTGALILFATVQITIIASNLVSGVTITRNQTIGMIIAFAGLVLLLSPSLKAPNPWGALLMVTAGVAWGFYTLLGKNNNAPIMATRNNFIIAALLSLPFFIILTDLSINTISHNGLLAAVASGAITSGLGYVLWYKVLPALSSFTAGLSQLSVPIITALLGVILLDETLSITTLLSGGIILSGIILSLKK